MTIQLSDTLLFRGERFAIIEVDDGTAFSSRDFVRPDDFGMQGRMTSTANRKGFSASYEVAASSLRLKHFALCERSSTYRPVGGVEPVLDADGDYASYSDVNLPIDFTGTVRIAAGVNHDSGAQLTTVPGEKPFPWAEVLALTFRGGRLVSAISLVHQ